MCLGFIWVSVDGRLAWPWWRGVSWNWTVLPVLARPRRWVRGTSRPCSSGCLAASSRAAWLASTPSSRLAWAWMAGPVVAAVAGQQHRLLADEPDQRRAGGDADLADHPAELAEPHDQGDGGDQG